MKKLFYFLLICILSISAINAQTFYTMSSGNYTQDFANISTWTASYASGTGASNWRVATSVTPSSVLNTTTVFSTGSSGGVQKGTADMVFLATGTNSTGTDLLLNFSGRTAGSITLDWAKIANTVSVTPRTSDIKIQYSIDNGLTFTDLTGYTIPRVTNNATAETGTLSAVALPTALDGQAQVVIRFYVWNNGQTAGSGNRPKISIDNISVTSSVLSTPSIIATPTTLSGFTYIEGSGPSTNQSFSVSATSLLGDLVLGAPSNYQIDTNSSGTYYDSITLAPSSGTVATRTIYARLKAGLLTAGSPYNQVLTIASTSATTVNINLNGTVTPLCIAPTSQPTALNFTTVTFNNIIGSFTSTTADGYLVVQSTSPTLSGTPSTGSTYTVGATVFGGTIISIGSGTSFNSTGLSSSTQYYYFVFAYNNLACGGGPAYNTVSPLSRDTTTLVAPCIAEGFTGTTTPATPTGWAFTSITGTYTSVGNFGMASPSVKFDATGSSQVTTSSIAPQMATSLSFWMKGQGTMTGSSLLVEGYIGGSWTTIHNITSISTTATTRLYNSSSTPALPLGVTQVRFTYNKVSGNLAFDDVILYCAPMPVCSEPTTQASGVNFTSVTHNSMTINWTSGSGDSSLVVVSQTSPVSVAPLDAITYNPTSVFGTIGAGRIVATGQYVVYTGGANSVNITNLLPSNTYHVAVFSFNQALTPCYLDMISGIASQTTLAPPIVISPTSLSTFTYDYGSGPSSIQNVSVSATGLTPSSGNVVITPLNAAYEVSTSFGGTYLSSITLPYTSSTLSSTPIYIRLISGLNIGNYNTQLQATNDVDTTKININGNVNVAPCSNLFFSEYIEGTSNEKYFEVYNASDFSIDLSNYNLMVYANGSVTATSIDSSITGLLSPHTVRVFKNSGALLYTGIATSTIATFYNGDDALVLFDKILNAPIDIIGRIGEDPGTQWASSGRTTLDKTLIRKFSVTRGVSINPSSGFPTLSTEWDTLSTNDITNLGIYRNVCCVPVSNSISESICAGTYYEFNGVSITSSGVYRDTLVNHLGCDSFLTLTLTLNPMGSISCPIPPVNDNMCNALDLTTDYVTTTPYAYVGYASVNTHTETISASNSLSSFQVGEPVGSCGGASFINKTMWYKIATPNCATPQLHISTDVRATTDFDTRISVYRRSNPITCSSTFTEIACNDNGTYYLNTGLTNNSSVVLSPNSVTTGALTNEYLPGEDIYVQTSGVGSSSGNYGLIIDAEPFIPTLSSIGAGSVVVDWSPVLTSTWGNISGAYIQWRPVGAPSTVSGTWIYKDATSTTHTITGLMPGVAYEVFASYVCGNGGRWWSKKATFTTNATCTVATPPTITSIATAPPRDCRRPSVTISAPGIEFSSYKIVRKRGSTLWYSGSYAPSASITYVDSRSLTYGWTYQYYIVGYCGSTIAYTSLMSNYTACSASRMSDPSAEEADVVYTLPTGEMMYGLPFNEIAWQMNEGEGEINLQTTDANTYFGREEVKEAVVAKVGEMSIYPNPATSEATISYTLEKEASSMVIRVMDAQGKEMMNETITNPEVSGIYNINLNNYSAGIYFVKIQAGDYTDAKKLVVDRH
jgi:hypothetical protein